MFDNSNKIQKCFTYTRNCVKSKEILVTGGAGFIGTNLVHELHAGAKWLPRNPRQQHNLKNLLTSGDQEVSVIDQNSDRNEQLLSLLPSK